MYARVTILFYVIFNGRTDAKVWIGGKYDSGSWKWADDDSLLYAKWGPSADKSGSKPNVYIDTASRHLMTAATVDTHGYICELDSNCKIDLLLLFLKNIIM